MSLSKSCADIDSELAFAMNELSEPELVIRLR
jgi:hypothetical protein